MSIFEKREKLYFAYLKISMLHKDLPQIIAINEKDQEFVIDFSVENLQEINPTEYQEIYFDSFEIIKSEVLDHYFDFPENVRFFRSLTNTESLLMENKLLKAKLEN
jgi:hypothetical protein